MEGTDGTVHAAMGDDFRIVEAPAAMVGSSPTTVVLDAQGEPYQIATGEGVFPAIVVAPGTAFADLAASGALTRMLMRSAPGVVVVDDGRIAGFVPRATLVQELLLAVGDRSGDAGSDPLLYGDPRPVSGAVRIRCLTCGTVNSFDFYLLGDQQQCVQGHPLDPDLG